MNTPDTFVRLGLVHAVAFDTFNPNRLSEQKGLDYVEYLADKPSYQPQFGDKMRRATAWVEGNPAEFTSMTDDLSLAIDYLNWGEDEIDTELYTNLAEYRKAKSGPDHLPKNIGERQGSLWSLSRAVIDSARRLRLGETTKPEDGECYGYHLYTRTDRGMVVASLLDLYENYARELGLYPENTDNGALISGALTEAAHITKPDGKLFNALQQKEDGWIFGYDGFSPKFQSLLYESS